MKKKALRQILRILGAVSAAANVAYAGDLQGNVWRVDITDPNPANWIVSVMFQAIDPGGAPQPITTVPAVTLNPKFPNLLGTMVYVGTGKLLVTLPGGGGAVTSLVFAPDGQSLAWATADGVIRLWKITLQTSRLEQLEKELAELRKQAEDATLAERAAREQAQRLLYFHQIQLAQQAWQAAVPGGQVSDVHAPATGDQGQEFALATADGGALVFYTDSAQVTVTAPAGAQLKLTVPGFISPGQALTQARVDYLEQFAAYDPPAAAGGAGASGGAPQVVAGYAAVTGTG